jgi:hypothetical protein
MGERATENAKLPSHERGTTRDEADDDGAERTCANLK